MKSTTTLSILAAALFATGSAAQADVGLRLYEVSGAPSGLSDAVWEVDVVTPTVVNPVAQDINNAIADFEFGHGVYYAPSTNINTDLFVLNPITGALLDTITMNFPAGGDVITSVEFVGDTLFGGFTTEGGGGPSSLVTINTTSGVVDMVGAMGINSPTGGLAYDGSTMYTVNSGAGGPATLYTVNLGDGSATAVGAVTLVTGAPVTLTGLEFGNDGVLYGLGRAQNQNQLFTINPASGEATLLGTLPAGSYTSLTTVPEPSAVLLLGVCLGAAAAARRRLSVSN